ncbi:MAG: hypothetical protein HYY63_07245, partial [Elusimicrobia bacterium]|nr:hypothetical protein [Elusimicrobiota bacterium]
MRRIPYRAFFCASFLLTQTAISHSEQSLDRYLYRLNKDAAPPNQFQIKTPYPQSQFSLPDYSLRMNPAGITYGGTASLNKGKESFLIPGLSGLQPNQIRGQHLGEGKIEVGGNKFSYSDLYTVIPWKDSQQIFTLAFGTAKGAENGGLFIGVGNSYDRSQTNREIENSLQSSKIGFLLPTGTGILLSPTSLPRQPHQTNFQSLHASWFNGSGSQSVPMTDKSKSANFLLSPALQIERNPLQNYFPKQVENIVQGKTHHPLAQEGEVSPQSLVRFFERTDPVSRSGPTQISYADPMNRRLEYMTSQGFHYKIAPYFGSRIEENIVVKQFGAGMGTDWTLLSSIQNRNSPQEQKILRLFSRQNQGTAQIYIAAGPLDLDSALQNGWMGKAKLLFQEENIWTRYSHAIQLGKQGLRKTSDALSRFAAGLQSNNVRPIYPNSSLDTNLQPAKPFFKQSQRILENLSRGLEIAQKTEFISPKEFEIFELRKRGVESSHAASKTLSQKLLIQNEILSQIQKEPSNFGLLSVQRKKFRELSDWIGNDLFQLHHTAQIFAVHDPGQAFFLYKARSQQLQKENFQESNLEYAKSKAYLDLAKNSLNPGIQIHAGGSMISSFFKGLALEGKEESSLWKRALGETGQFASWILPFSGLGERMVLAYDQPQYPSQSDLLTVGALQTVTDGLKILNLGGIQKGVKSFSQESLRISLKSLRSQSLPLGGLGLASGVQGVTDNLCEDCPFLQKTIGLTAFVGGLGSLHIGKKIAEKMRLEGEFLSPNLKRAWKLSKPVLFQESLPAFSRETATYLTLIGSEKAVASLLGLFYLRDHPFLTGQTQLTLEPALPFLAGRVGAEISGFTFKKRFLPPSQNSFFDSPRTERQRESVSSLRSLLGKQEFHAAEIEQLKAGMIQFLEEAGNIQKRTGETSEINSPFRLKRSQVSGLENSIQALLSKESPSLPIHVHLLPTGSGKTTLAMGQILAARLRDIPLQKRTHVQSNTESNLAQLYQTARDLYGSSLGKMGFIPETSSETMAKKIAQESDILFLT